MKALIAATLVALSLMTTAAAAVPYSNTYQDYPTWAQHAFNPDDGH
ncbi:MAG: hypothetical protein R3D44_12345 [Hyphomicrobiaceae bacterium]